MREYVLCDRGYIRLIVVCNIYNSTLIIVINRIFKIRLAFYVKSIWEESEWEKNILLRRKQKSKRRT